MGLSPVRQLLGDLRADLPRATSIAERVSVIVLRLNQAAHRGCGQIFKKPLPIILDAIWLDLFMGSEIPAETQIGPGLRLCHGGRGVFLHPHSIIGRNATIYHRVTAGVSGGDASNIPHFGDNVYVGTGALIIGGVTLGDGCKVGAGAVVTKDVPPGSIAVGNPARLLPSGRLIG